MFCEVCCHKVFNIGKHVKTEEHRRALKRIALGGLKPPSEPIKYHSMNYGIRMRKEQHD